jgi:uncharacterized protein YceH (UPF0502 family)
MSTSPPGKSWLPLSARERRVVGVLIEKQKTTPEYYPLSVNAIVTGCNQKSNRDPLTNFDADDVEEILQDLRKKGAAVMVEGSGRVVRWKHTLYDWLGLKGREVDMAVIAELLLRGPQTEGDLRSRASRMNPIADLAALQAVLERLQEQGLVIYLTPPGQRRGVVVTHALYPNEELERVRQAHASAAVVEDDEPRSPRAAGSGTATGWAAEATALRAEIEALRAELQALTGEVRALRTDLGA